MTSLFSRIGVAARRAIRLRSPPKVHCAHVQDNAVLILATSLSARCNAVQHVIMQHASSHLSNPVGNQIECRLGQAKRSPPANQKPSDTMEGSALGISLSLPDSFTDVSRASTNTVAPASVVLLENIHSRSSHGRVSG